MKVTSQKEVFFDNTPKESVAVQKLKGFEIGYTGATRSTFLDLLFNSSLTDIYQPNEVLNTFQVAYFREHKLFHSAVVIIKGGLHLTPIKHGSFIHNGFEQTFTGYRYVQYYGFHLTLEPRWYMGFRKRFSMGKAKLNSGAFLTCPLEYICTINPSSNIEMCLSPQLGFRQALSNHLFIEGNLGAKLTNNGLIFLQSEDYWTYIRVSPTASLKVSYTL